MEREREADRLLDLVDEATQAGEPPDRRDRRSAVRDPEVGEPARCREHVVDVEHRLAHAHEDRVVDLARRRRKWSAWSRISEASGSARSASAPVAQNVHVSGQPDWDERQSERRPSR